MGKYFSIAAAAFGAAAAFLLWQSWWNNPTDYEFAVSEAAGQLVSNISHESSMRTMAVLPDEVDGRFDPGSENLAELVQMHLLWAGAHLVSRKDLKKALAEQNFQKGFGADAERMESFGKMVGADGLLMVRLVSMADRGPYLDVVLSARLVRVDGADLVWLDRSIYRVAREALVVCGEDTPPQPGPGSCWRDWSLRLWASLSPFIPGRNAADQYIVALAGAVLCGILVMAIVVLPALRNGRRLMGLRFRPDRRYWACGTPGNLSSQI